MESLLVLMYLWIPLASVEDAYAGGGAGIVTLAQDDIPDYTMLNAYARMGTHLNDYLAVEMRYGVSTQDKNDIEGEGTAINIRRSTTGYLVGSYPIDDQITPYALFGYTKTDLNQKPSIPNMPSETSSFSYGIGAEYEYSEGASIGAEYVFLHNTDKPGDIGNLSITLKFDINDELPVLTGK